jgi:hypothetical protein
MSIATEPFTNAMVGVIAEPTLRMVSKQGRRTRSLSLFRETA